MKKRATLRDVAKSAGVSVATVSRVLNDSEKVTEETRVKVNTVIEELEFSPSAAARSLSLGRSRTVGALVPTLDHSIYARYLNGLEDCLSQLGYGLIVSVTGGVPEIVVEKAHSLLQMGVEGLIVSGVQHSDKLESLSSRFGTPVLITSYYDPDAPFPTVSYDNRTVAAAAIEYLYGLGHRNIGIVHGPVENNDRTKGRIEGVYLAKNDAHLTFSEAEISVEGGVSAMADLLNKGCEATAVLCLSDVLVLGALFELQRRNISIPGQISLMGFDNLEWSAVSQPGITSIDLPAGEMGRQAGLSMVNWLVSKTPAESINLPAEIIIRQSTRQI